jgi:sialate O-acetylesterase
MEPPIATLGHTSKVRKENTNMKTRLHILLLFVPTILPHNLSAGELKLAGIFMDHAVLQRDIRVPVWGWSAPGSKVRVSFAGQQHSATADASGKWTVRLEPMEASSTGRELKATTSDGSVSIHDILVGEVWHASGQSNMAGHTNTAFLAEYERGKKVIEEIDNQQIRFCNIQMDPSGIPQKDLNMALAIEHESGTYNRWMPATPETYGPFSAIALFFAKELYSELQVPIGVIATPKGGAQIEYFVSAGSYKKMPSFKQGSLDTMEGQERAASYVATTIYNGRIHPILGYGIAGMIWYQGESNTRSDAAQYSDKLSIMVQGLREAWGQGDFPFYYVQLCAHGDDLKYNNPGWPIVQDQMRLALEMIPNSGMCVTNDIDGHHPKNKVDGAERLAAWALARTYNREIPYSGPLYRKHTVVDNKVTVYFDHSGSGLMLCEKDGLDPPIEVPNEDSQMFQLAGEDGVWHDAQANLVGGTVEVTSPAVKGPLHVRYAFKESLSGPRVYNREGLPMSTFTSKILQSDIEELAYYNSHIKLDRLKEKRAKRK